MSQQRTVTVWLQMFDTLNFFFNLAYSCSIVYKDLKTSLLFENGPLLVEIGAVKVAILKQSRANFVS